jgi:hypothetical protein
VLDTVTMTRTIQGFWRKCRAKFDKSQRRNFDRIMMELMERKEQKNFPTPINASNSSRYALQR